MSGRLAFLSLCEEDYVLICYQIHSEDHAGKAPQVSTPASSFSTSKSEASIDICYGFIVHHHITNEEAEQDGA